ncbi:MAG: gamma-glutamyltransferase family protein [Firmicutes bacterium]|nr:gamma-glutamyltransferase family protein [Bacillota bacterium]
MDLQFDPLNQRYPSIRYPLYARGGMVNCSSPQASAAGLEALRKGGNAMDAAVAAAAALTVVKPTSNGLGSDAFALIWSEKEQKLFGLNSSGRAPMLATIEAVLASGKAKGGKMPRDGWIPVTVPGAPKAWSEVVRRFGRLTLAEDLAPAVRYARDGYPCPANLSAMWKDSFRVYEPYADDPAFAAWFETFAPSGRTPRVGEMVVLADHADTLEEIGATDAESFYSGELAKRIDAESRRFGGYLRYEDMAAHRADWVEPISVNYRGYDVCEIPPNGQGIVCLMALNILKEFAFTDRDGLQTVHRQLEAMKMAFADAFRYVTDAAQMEIDHHDLLQPSYGAMRAAEMTDRAKVWTHRLPPKSGTVYLATADGEGNMVSFIQSNYNGFGSGIVIPGTGIALQNRGADFSLDPAAANCLKPGKRSYHTIIPGFLMKDGKPVGPFGVMGAYMQPQGHVQVVMNAVDFHLDPQQCLNAPRWQWLRDGRVILEPGFGEPLAAQLRAAGHDVTLEPNYNLFGRGQMIVRLDNGVLCGGTEPRCDSNIACF